MPNGPTHRALTGILQLLTLPVSLVSDSTEFIGLQIGMGLTYFVNPDLDITTNRLGIVKHLGFESYRKLVPHRFGLSSKHWHTSIGSVMFFSHFPLIGTVIRTVLVLLPLIVAMLFTNSLSLLSIKFVFFVYLGMALSDTLHIVADIIYSARKSL